MSIVRNKKYKLLCFSFLSGLSLCSLPPRDPDNGTRANHENGNWRLVGSKHSAALSCSGMIDWGIVRWKIGNLRCPPLAFFCLKGIFA